VKHPVEESSMIRRKEHAAIVLAP